MPSPAETSLLRVGLSRGCGHNAVTRIYDEAGDVVETHEHMDEFKEP
jgi:hypothetical protein